MPLPFSRTFEESMLFLLFYCMYDIHVGTNYDEKLKKRSLFSVKNFNQLNVLQLKNKNQLDATYYFIVLLIGSTCFGHYYAHHQDLATMMLITTLVVSFLVCCM